MAWTEERIALLKDYWTQGLSCSLIAQRINEETGASFSRNAIIGKRVRVGLPDHGSRFGRSQQARKQRKARRAAKHVWRSTNAKAELAARSAMALADYQAIRSAPDLDIPKAERKTILVRKGGKLHANEALCNRSCRWALNDGPVFEFCGRETVRGLPYCEHHSARAYNPPALASRLIRAETEAWHAKNDPPQAPAVTAKVPETV